MFHEGTLHKSKPALSQNNRNLVFIATSLKIFLQDLYFAPLFYDNLPVIFCVSFVILHWILATASGVITEGSLFYFVFENDLFEHRVSTNLCIVLFAWILSFANFNKNRSKRHRCCSCSGGAVVAKFAASKFTVINNTSLCSAISAYCLGKLKCL